MTRRAIRSIDPEMDHILSTLKPEHQHAFKRVWIKLFELGLHGESNQKFKLKKREREVVALVTSRLEREQK